MVTASLFHVIKYIGTVSLLCLKTVKIEGKERLISKNENIMSPPMENE